MGQALPSRCTFPLSFFPVRGCGDVFLFLCQADYGEKGFGIPHYDRASWSGVGKRLI